MSQENVEIFKRSVEAWNRDDFDAWIDQIDPEIECFVLMEVFRGHAGARQLWDSFKGNAQLRVCASSQTFSSRFPLTSTRLALRAPTCLPRAGGGVRLARISARAVIV